jgi:hypothetical protein
MTGRDFGATYSWSLQWLRTMVVEHISPWCYTGDILTEGKWFCEKYSAHRKGDF